jgi:uncharacterized protein
MMCSVAGQIAGRTRLMQLKLNLRSLQGDHEHFEKRYESSLFDGIGGDLFRVVSPVTLSFDIDRQDTDRYHVAGHLEGALEVTCSRCLEAFALRVAPEFDLGYVSRTENVGEGEREVNEDDLTTAFYSDDQIDLGELIAEQFHLAMPMKPLCAEDCKGLCAQCGTNLNIGACNCSHHWTDPRLAALKELARKSKN